jgi:hypothetical protein
LLFLDGNKDHPTVGDDSAEENTAGSRKPRKKWNTKTKYTMDPKESQMKSFGGWNNEGKIMFNKVLAEIKVDRMAHPNWEKSYRNTMAETAYSLDASRKKGKAKAPVVTVSEEIIYAANDISFDSDVDDNTSKDDAPFRDDGSEPNNKNSDSEDSED